MIKSNLKDAGTIVDTIFAYDATSRKISMHVEAVNVVTLISDLASIMGISPRQITFRDERKHKGKVAMDPNRGFHSLYVYCDTAEAILVGDIKATLLRVVDVAGNFENTIHRLYTTPQYVSVSRKEFNTVEIDIREVVTNRPFPTQFVRLDICVLVRLLVRVVIRQSSFHLSVHPAVHPVWLSVRLSARLKCFADPQTLMLPTLLLYQKAFNSQSHLLQK